MLENRYKRRNQCMLSVLYTAHSTIDVHGINNQVQHLTLTLPSPFPSALCLGFPSIG